MNHILLEHSELGAEGHASLTDRRADHIRRVLGLVAGDTLRIGLVDGPRGVATLTAADADHVALHCEWDPHPPPLPRLDVLLALPRPKVMKRLWAPLASFGLGRIIICNAAKVERNYFDTHWLDPAFSRPRLLEGLQQAELTRMPKVDVRRRFRPLIEDELDVLCPDTRRVVCDPDADGRMGDVDVAPDRRLLLAIGPEGGWTPFELELMATHGFHGVSLAGGPLRTDVACMALLALAREHLRDEPPYRQPVPRNGKGDAMA